MYRGSGAPNSSSHALSSTLLPQMILKCDKTEEDLDVCVVTDTSQLGGVESMA